MDEKKDRAMKTLKMLDLRLSQAHAMEQLLRQLRSWDHLVSAADGPYWLSQINEVLGDT